MIRGEDGMKRVIEIVSALSATTIGLIGVTDEARAIQRLRDTIRTS